MSLVSILTIINPLLLLAATVLLFYKVATRPVTVEILLVALVVALTHVLVRLPG
jgi:hypothetical protein